LSRLLTPAPSRASQGDDAASANQLAGRDPVLDGVKVPRPVGASAANDAGERGVRIFALEYDQPDHRRHRQLDWAGPVDLMNHFANPLPLDVIYDIIGADPEFKPEMKALVDALLFRRSAIPGCSDPRTTASAATTGTAWRSDTVRIAAPASISPPRAEDRRGGTAPAHRAHRTGGTHPLARTRGARRTAGHPRVTAAGWRDRWRARAGGSLVGGLRSG
jgi:hypothetical protein